MPDWLPLATAITLGGALIGIGIWIGSVNTDRVNFKEFMREIRDKIDKIFERLPPVVTVGQSPVRLTDLGRSISKELDAAAWARSAASNIQNKAQGLEAYAIQELSFAYADDAGNYSTGENSGIRRSAYEKGVDQEQVRRVFGVELRDVLLAISDMDAP